MGYVFRLFLYLLVVLHLQRLHARGVLADTSPHVSARSYHYDIGAHLREVLPDGLLGALAYRHHHYDSGDTDDDAEHGKE